MTVARPILLDDTDSRRRVVRAGDAGAICHAIAKRNRIVGGHRVQSVRECVQQPAIGLAATIFACKRSPLMMSLKKLHTFTILLRGHPEINLRMMSMPTHSSRQFRFAALLIILLTVPFRLPSLLASISGW